MTKTDRETVDDNTELMELLELALEDTKGKFMLGTDFAKDSIRDTLLALLTERDQLKAENERLREALDVYADICDATETTPCGYEGNLCCMTARAALEANT